MEEKYVVQTHHGALRAVLILEGGQGLKGKFMSCFTQMGSKDGRTVLSVLTVSPMP